MANENLPIQHNRYHYTMSDTAKRYLISTSETFATAFSATFLLLLSQALENGMVDQAIIISIVSASASAGLKVVVKVLNFNKVHRYVRFGFGL
jgi:hypothetical protein